MIVFAAIMPHPPESIPGIGKPESLKAMEKTLNAFEELRIGLEKSDPEIVVIISPHAYSEPYFFVINSSSKLTGSFADLGLNETYSYINDIKIASRLEYACLMGEIPARLHMGLLDYGTLIPLYHLAKNIKPKVVQISFSKMSYDFHYRYGEILREVLESSQKRVAIITGGSLSHKLTPGAPAGFSPEGKKFDADILHYLENNDLPAIMNLDKKTVEEAAECSLRSIIILLGVLHGKKYEFKLLSYEHPLGIGYLTARLI
jgi:aromatic ring-opening dioxygenase LigB subunit